jgi:hypothetical protein
MLDAHQVWMPYVPARVVNAGSVIIAMNSERSGLRGRDHGAATNVDYLRMMLNGRNRKTN